MKRFLVRTFLFLSVPVLLGVAWTVYVVWMDYASYTRALVLPEETTVAVCGDSQTKDALDPAHIPGLANFSTAATTCDQDLLRLFDLLVANRGRLRYVLLDVSPLKIGYMEETSSTPPSPPRPVSELNAARVHALLHVYHLTENRRPFGSVGALWRDVICVRKYNEFRKSVLRGKKWRSSMAGAFDPDKAQGFLNPKFRAKALADVDAKADRVNRRPPAQVGLPLFAVLVEAVGLVRAAGAEPVMTTMPLARPLREKMDAAKVAAFTEAARDVAVRLGVPYLDYLQLDLPEALWHDGNHLNRAGAAAFSPRFAADFAAVRRRIAAKNGPEGLRVTRLGDFRRPQEPDDLSGLCWTGGDTFWSVRDSGGELCELRIPVDPQTGRVRSCEVVRVQKVPVGRDLEGCAYDPLRRSFWMSDEAGPAIFEYRLAETNVLARVDLPRDLLSVRKNRGLEALEISPDGLSMWTCNENELPADDAALPGPGEFLRLTRFSRRDAKGKWHLSGQWAYRPEVPGGVRIRAKARNGVSSIVQLEDGSVLVLEREQRGRAPASYRIRICLLDFAGATDVRGWTSLGDADFTPVRKQVLFQADVGRSMYEGMSLGPVLSDGSRVLVLISDGDGAADESILTLRLDQPRPACSSR